MKLLSLLVQTQFYELQ